MSDWNWVAVALAYTVGLLVGLLIKRRGVMKVICAECKEEFETKYDMFAKPKQNYWLCGHCSEERIKDEFGYVGNIL